MFVTITSHLRGTHLHLERHQFERTHPPRKNNHEYLFQVRNHAHYKKAITWQDGRQFRKYSSSGEKGEP